MNEVLVAEGFRNIRKAQAPARGLVVITGDHGAGKSTLVGAIGTALAGRNRWTDKSGKGLDQQIGHGHAAAHIRLDVAGKTVHRDISPGSYDFKLDGAAGNQSVQAKAFLNHLKTTKEVLDVACDTQVLFESSPKEQADIIFGALAGKITATDLASYLVTTGGLAETDVQAIIASAEESGVTFPVSPDGLDKLSKVLYDTRTAVKKSLGAAEEELRNAPVTDSVSDANGVIDIERLEHEQSERRRKKAKAEADAEARATIAKMGDGEPIGVIKAKVAQAEKTTSDSEIAAVTARKVANNAILAVPSLVTVPDAPDRHDGRNGWGAVVEIADENDRAFGSVDTDDKTAAHVMNILAPVSKNDERLRQIAKVNGFISYDDVIKVRQEAKKKQAEVAKQREAALVSAKELERAAHEAEVKASAARLELQKLESSLENDRRRQAALASLSGAEGVNIEELNAEIKDADEIIFSIRTRIANVKASERINAIRVKAQAKIESLRPRVNVLNAVLDLLHPTKRTALIEAKAGVILAKLATAFKGLTKDRYSLHISLSPFEIRVQKQGDDTPTGIDSLSASEKFRTAVLLQDAVSSIGHAPILAIDGADILMPEEFEALMRYLETRKDRYQAIFVTAAIGEDDPRGKCLGKWQHVIIDNGEAFSLGLAEAA